MLKRIIRKIVCELRMGYNLLAMLLPSYVLTALADESLRFRHRLNGIVRRRNARLDRSIVPLIESKMKAMPCLQREILESRTSWLSLPIPVCPVPSMITEDEMHYYHYITQFYSGIGDVVEIGPWIGSSTYNIVGGLLNNPAFTEEKHLYVYDDFIWRSSWMNKWLLGSSLEPLNNNDSFLPLFRKMTNHYANHIDAKAMKLMDTVDNSHVPDFKWEHGVVELCFIDCGRALTMNETWYDTLRPYFIPDRTIIVMQDWQNFKNVPEIFWENTKIFTDSKGSHLDQIHELKGSGVATFIYRG